MPSGHPTDVLFKNSGINPETGSMTPRLKKEMEKIEREAIEEIGRENLPKSRSEALAMVTKRKVKRKVAKKTAKRRPIKKKVAKKKVAKKKVRRREPEDIEDAEPKTVGRRTKIVVPPRGKATRDTSKSGRQTVRVIKGAQGMPFFPVRRKEEHTGRPTWRDPELEKAMVAVGCSTHGSISYDIIFPGWHLGLPAFFCKRCKQVFSVFDLDVMSVDDAKTAVRSLGVEVVDG